MKAEFSIRVDVANDLVRITMAGFFERDDIARFAVARDAAHRLLRSRPNEHVTLVDIRDMDIQAQDSVAGFRALLANPAVASRRIAFVVARSLARTQLRRAAESRDPRYFMTVEDAESWLLDRAERLSA